MATFEPSLPLGAKIKPPEGCTCGDNVMCPLHFDKQDYLPGLQVAFNPYTVYKYGLPEKSLSGLEIFVIERVGWGDGETEYDDNGVFYLNLRGSGCWHVGWMRPWGFMTYVKRALEEEQNA